MPRPAQLPARRLDSPGSAPRPVSALVLAIALAACASPQIRLAHRYTAGATRAYRLHIAAATKLDVGTLRRTERTDLRARVTIEPIDVKPGETTLRLRITPERFAVDGRASTSPGEQVVELVTGADGAVKRVTSVGGVPASEAGADAEELAPFLGAPLPQGSLRLGRRWTRSLPAIDIDSPGGLQRGRLAALRRVDGYDCAIIALGTERPLRRQRTVEGTTVSLAGTEYSTTELAFDFRQGVPVRIATKAEAHFIPQGEGLAGGTVTITGSTLLELA